MGWPEVIATLTVLLALELGRALCSRAAEQRAQGRWAGYVENDPDAGVVLVEVPADSPTMPQPVPGIPAAERSCDLHEASGPDQT